MKNLKLLIILILFSFKIQAQKIENITLQSVTDNSTFRLSESKGKYVALHFLLKTECPYCIRHTSEYFEKAKSLPNVIQVFIKPDEEKEIKEWTSKLNLSNSLPIYQDKNAQLANQLNIPFGYSFHGQIVHYPALILLNEQGIEVFRYIGKNNTDRFSFENLKAKIEALSNSK